MLYFSIFAVALIILFGILIGSERVPGENRVGFFGTIVIVVECFICFVYAFKYAPTVPVVSSNAVAIKLAIMLVFGVILVFVGDYLHSKKVERANDESEQIKQIIKNNNKRKDRL